MKMLGRQNLIDVNFATLKLEAYVSIIVVKVHKI